MDRSEWVRVPRVPTEEMCEAAPSLPPIELPADTERYRGWKPYAVQNAKRYAAMLAAAPPPPAEQASGELAALRVQEWLQREYDVLPPVQEIERAMQTPCSCPYVEAALAPQQQGGAE